MSRLKRSYEPAVGGWVDLRTQPRCEAPDDLAENCTIKCSD